MVGLQEKQAAKRISLLGFRKTGVRQRPAGPRGKTKAKRNRSEEGEKGSFLEGNSPNRGLSLQHLEIQGRQDASLRISPRREQRETWGGKQKSNFGAALGQVGRTRGPICHEYRN